MVQILQRPETSGQRLARGIHGAASEGIPLVAQYLMQQRQQKEQLAQQQQQIEQEDAAISRLLGQDVRGLSPELKQLFLQESMKQQTAGQKLAGEGKEKMQVAQGGLQTLQRMRDLGKTGHLGFTLKPNRFAPEQAAARGEYEQLGKSLIQLSSQIPIRNQMEFETLAHKLYNPSLSDGEREGVLNAMERIIRQSIGEETEQPSEKRESQKMFKLGGNQERPPLKSFYR